MIVDNHDRFAICTPCKTGTMSLEATLRTRYPIAYQYGGRHGWSYEGAGDRLMVVRHPWDRWWSMFHFIQKHVGRSCYFQEYAHDVNVFTEEWAKRCEAGEVHWWFYTQAFMHERFNPTLVFKLEDGLHRVTDWLRENHDRNIPEVSKTNVNHRKREGQTLTAENTKLVFKFWVEPDCERFGYATEDVLH